MKQLIDLLLIASIAVIVSCNGYYHFITAPLPPQPVIFKAKQPGPGYQWINGEWFWNGNNYSWHEGYWITKPGGYDWHPGTWQKRKAGWYWQPGQWKKEISSANKSHR